MLVTLLYDMGFTEFMTWQQLIQAPHVSPLGWVVLKLHSGGYGNHYELHMHWITCIACISKFHFDQESRTI
jgi:hypothetical protein